MKTEQPEFWTWEREQSQGSSYNRFDFLLKREEIAERNEDRFRAKRAQRDFFKKLEPTEEAIAAASVRNFKRNQADAKRLGRRLYRGGFFGSYTLGEEDSNSDIQPIPIVSIPSPS
jgi:hypothetical protein